MLCLVVTGHNNDTHQSEEIYMGWASRIIIYEKPGTQE